MLAFVASIILTGAVSVLNALDKVLLIFNVRLYPLTKKNVLQGKYTESISTPNPNRSGGYRISQRRGANHKGWGTNLLFWPILLQKRHENEKILHPELGARLWRSPSLRLDP